MRVFKQKKERVSTPQQDEVASKIARGIVEKQRQLAIWLNNRARQSGNIRTLSILIFLALVLGAYCLWLILSALL